MNLTKKLFVFREQFERCCALATLLERKENAGCPNQNLVLQHQKTGIPKFGFETHILVYWSLQGRLCTRVVSTRGGGSVFPALADHLAHFRVQRKVVCQIGRGVHFHKNNTSC